MKKINKFSFKEKNHADYPKIRIDEGYESNWHTQLV